MARVRDMRNIKKVEDEQSQNTGNHPHGMTDCEVCTSLDSYIENDKKVEGTKEEFKEEVVVHDEFDYKKMSKMIADDLCELHKRFSIGGVRGQNYPPKNESVDENVNDFTNNDNDYVHFLESQVAQLQYKLHLLESGE